MITNVRIIAMKQSEINVSHHTEQEQLYIVHLCVSCIFVI